MSNQLGNKARSGAVELAAPLDLLLTSSAVGVAERMMSKRLLEQVRAQPCQATAHRGIPGRRPGARTSVDHRGALRSGTAQGRQAFRRSGMAGKSVTQADNAVCTSMFALPATRQRTLIIAGIDDPVVPCQRPYHAPAFAKFDPAPALRRPCRPHHQRPRTRARDRDVPESRL